MASASGPTFSIAETHARALRPGNRLIAHSEGLGWHSLYAALFVEAPFETTEVAVDHPSFIYHISRPTEVTRKIEGSAQERELIVPRRITLTPGGAVARWQHSGQPEILHVYLRQSLFEGIAAEMYDCEPARVEVRPRFAIRDPLLEQLAIVIADTLRERAEGSAVFMDTLAQMLAAQLARAHSSLARPPRIPAPGRFADWRLRRLANFIEANLEEELSLEAMAAEVGLSPLYLIRTFKSAFGESPHRYVLQRRIERAKDLLRTTEMPVAEVAYAVGLSSQSHLAHWFRRMVGVSPGAYRRQS